MPKLDITKPVQTRDGLSVEIYATSRGMIIGFIEKCNVLFKWDMDGQVFGGLPGAIGDLINVPQPPTYRPWTAKEAATHVGEKVKSKDASVLSGIISRVEKAGGIWIGGSYTWNAVDVFDRFIFLDGTPCGQKVD